MKERKVRFILKREIKHVIRVLNLLPENTVIVHCKTLGDDHELLDFLLESDVFPEMEYQVEDGRTYYTASGWIKENNSGKVKVVLTAPDMSIIYEKEEA
jgi:hypothetical protein